MSKVQVARVRSALLALLIVLGAAGHSHAISMRLDVPEQDYLNLAAPFGAVGRISAGSVSSGTLVSPTKFLTAAHSVDSNRDGVLDSALGNYRLRFGVNVTSPTHLISALTSIVIHPQWSATGGNRTYDLAVVTLTSPLTQVTPIGISDRDPLSMTATMVGYGLHGTGNNFGTSNSLDGLRRAATNIVDVASTTTVRTDFDSPAQNTNQYGSASPLALEGSTAGGDSGGPLLADFGAGPRIVGVLSGGFNNFGAASAYGDVSIYAPIANDLNIAFLAAQGIVIPEPGVVLLLAVGVLLVAVHRARPVA